MWAFCLFDFGYGLHEVRFRDVSCLAPIAAACGAYSTLWDVSIQPRSAKSKVKAIPSELSVWPLYDFLMVRAVCCMRCQKVMLCGEMCASEMQGKVS